MAVSRSSRKPENNENRISKQLNGEEPDMDFTCIFCNYAAYPIETRRVEHLPCCGKVVHIKCLTRWEISSQQVKCGHCRQSCNEFQVRYPKIAQRVTQEN